LGRGDSPSEGKSFIEERTRKENRSKRGLAKRGDRELQASLISRTKAF